MVTLLFWIPFAFEGLGNAKLVGVDYKELAHDVKPQDILLLDDGKNHIYCC